MINSNLHPIFRKILETQLHLYSAEASASDKDVDKHKLVPDDRVCSSL